MRSFILLLKIQLLGLFGINKALHANAAKAKRALALAALAVAAVVAVAALYSAGVAETLVRLGMAEAVPLVAVLVGSVAGAVAAFLKANGVLFAFKDYDLVMSLPVSTVSVVLSRIASLYAMSVMFGLLVMVPAFAVYVVHAGAAPLSVAFMALSVLLAPIIPLALAIVLAALIAAFSSRFRHANVVVVVLSMAALVGFLALYFFAVGQSGSMDELAALGVEQVDLFASIYPPAAWATAGIAQGGCRVVRVVRRRVAGGGGRRARRARAPVRAGEHAAHGIACARLVLVRERGCARSSRARRRAIPVSRASVEGGPFAGSDAHLPAQCVHGLCAGGPGRCRVSGGAGDGRVAAQRAVGRGRSAHRPVRAVGPRVLLGYYVDDGGIGVA